MNLNFFRTFVVATLILSVFFFQSCKDDEIVQTDEITAENIEKSAEIDGISDNVSNIIEFVYTIEEGITGQSKSNPFLPECLTKTVVINGNTRTVTLNFEENCVMPNGNAISGIVNISYVRDPDAHTRTITYEFSDFYFNDVSIAGGGTIFREKENALGNPQSTKNQDIVVTWANGLSAHRVGEIVSEWIEGFYTIFNWSDNVFSITGNWTTEFSNTNVNMGLVTTPLRRELSCPYIVSGVVNLSHNAIEGTLNYGDGTCDNEAIFTGPNGVEQIIILQKLH